MRGPNEVLYKQLSVEQQKALESDQKYIKRDYGKYGCEDAYDLVIYAHMLLFDESIVLGPESDQAELKKVMRKCFLACHSDHNGKNSLNEMLTKMLSTANNILLKSPETRSYYNRYLASIYRGRRNLLRPTR